LRSGCGAMRQLGAVARAVAGRVPPTKQVAPLAVKFFSTSPSQCNMTVPEEAQLPTHAQVCLLFFAVDTNGFVLYLDTFLPHKKSFESCTLCCGSALILVGWFLIRIGNADPDPGVKKWPTKMKKCIVLKCWIFSLTAGGVNLGCPSWRKNT
jgi:hypothetical protein